MKKFSGLRKIFFPVRRNEVVQFIIMAAIIACLLFAYTTARIVKDGLFIASGHGTGAEALPFIKSYVVLPSAMLFVYVYSTLDKEYSRKTMFVGVLGFFAVFFALYAWMIHPYTNQLNLSKEAVEVLQAAYPRFRQFLAIYGNWTYSLFYVIADISGNIMITFMFWQLAAQVVRSKEDASRIYVAYGMYGNVTGIISAGLLGRILTCVFGAGDLVRARIVAAAISLFIAIGLYLIMYYYILHEADREAPVQKKSKPKLSMYESIKLLTSSGYLFCIAVVVLCYGVGINLVEVTWKGCIKMKYNPKEFMEFFDNLYIMMGSVTFITGIVSTRITSSLGWLGQACTTPIVLAITGTSFYVFYLIAAKFFGVAVFNMVGVLADPVMIAIYMGLVQNIVSKSCKYTLFDPSTQVTYTALPADVRTTGKAAVDVIAGRFGKSGGGFIQSVLIMLYNSGSVVEQSGINVKLIPVIGGIFICICIAWLIAVLSLNKQYRELSAQQEKHSKKG